MVMKKTTMSLRKRRRGAVTVEMAIAAPVLFILVFGALEFCGANVQRHTVDNAAYEAARRGIVPGATVADVEARATEIMSFVGATNGINVNVTPAAITDATPELTVRVESSIAANGWIMPIFFADDDLLVGECTMRREELE